MVKRMTNKLDKLRAKSEVRNFNGLELKLYGLTFKELCDFASFVDKKDVNGAFDFLLFSAIRKAFPTKDEDSENGMSDEEIKKEMEDIDGKTGMDIVKVIQEISGIGEEGLKKEGATESLPNKK